MSSPAWPTIGLWHTLLAVKSKESAAKLPAPTQSGDGCRNEIVIDLCGAPESSPGSPDSRILYLFASCQSPVARSTAVSQARLAGQPVSTRVYDPRALRECWLARGRLSYADKSASSSNWINWDEVRRKCNKCHRAMGDHLQGRHLHGLPTRKPVRGARELARLRSSRLGVFGFGMAAHGKQIAIGFRHNPPRQLHPSSVYSALLGRYKEAGGAGGAIIRESSKWRVIFSRLSRINKWSPNSRVIEF